MSVVIDASALVAFVTNEPMAPGVAELLQRWGSEGSELTAPMLARYEIANALTKQAVPRAENSREQPRTTEPEPQCFRGFRQHLRRASRF